jgi:site-specific DNA recombinase
MIVERLPQCCRIAGTVRDGLVPPEIFSREGAPYMLSKFARAARQRIRLEGGGYRRDHLRALAQRVEVAEGEVRIMGSKSRLLQTLVANGGANAVPTQGLKWRRGRDSNPRYGYPYAAFRVRCFQPLSHLSVAAKGARMYAPAMYPTRDR